MVEQIKILNRKEVPRQEIAEACGYEKIGSHGFFYAFSELKAEGMLTVRKNMGKLTELGIESAPNEEQSFAKPKTNKDTHELFYKLLRKKCKEGTDVKVRKIFDILCDGEPHPIKDFIKASGYTDKKSKGLGYNLTCMERDMKILERTSENKYQFTDKCFPKGRPN